MGCNPYAIFYVHHWATALNGIQRLCDVGDDVANIF